MGHIGRILRSNMACLVDDNIIIEYLNYSINDYRRNCWLNLKQKRTQCLTHMAKRANEDVFFVASQILLALAHLGQSQKSEIDDSSLQLFYRFAKDDSYFDMLMVFFSSPLSHLYLLSTI